MKLIAHRGNLNGPNFLRENDPSYIDEAINLGFDVEIDVRYNISEKKFYLGHDYSQYSVTLNWINQRMNSLWIHCKNMDSLYYFSSETKGYNYFWHQEDDFTLTSKNYIWTYPGKSYTPLSIIVLPEINTDIKLFNNLKLYKCFGICSDYVNEI